MISLHIPTGQRTPREEHRTMKNLKKFSVTFHSKNGATEKVFAAWDALSAFDQAEKYAFANGYGVGTVTEIEKPAPEQEEL